MLESLTGDDVFSSVVMLRAADNLAVVLVEGDGDAKCLTPHIDPDHARVLPCHGSSNLDRARELIDEQALTGVLAVRDADWFGVLSEPVPSDNLVYTDLYDLDATIILLTDVGRRIALVFGQPDQVHAACMRFSATSPSELVVRVAEGLGLLRAASHLAGAGLSLRDFPIHEVFDQTSLVLVEDRMIAIAIARTVKASVTVEEVRSALTQARSLGVEPARLCSGHDLAAALSLLCRSAWGGASLRREFVLQAVRSALSCADLRNLQLFRSVENWELRAGYKVWACPREPQAA
jgi:hypothetical protein